MAGYAAAYSRSFDFGRAFGHVFSAVWRNAPVLLALNGCVIVASFALQMGLRALIGPAPYAPGSHLSGAAIAAFVFGAVVSLLQIGFQTAVVNYLVGGERSGPPRSFGESFTECAGVGARKCLPIVGLYLLQAIPIYIGLLFFLIPGVILALVWLVTAPALVNEDIGVFAAFSRSADLTRDNRAVLFGFSLVLWILLIVAFYAILGVGIMLFAGLGMSAGLGSPSLASSPAAGPMVIVAGLLASVAFTLVSCLAMSISASAYNELRRVKDGGQDVATVFN